MCPKAFPGHSRKRVLDVKIEIEKKQGRKASDSDYLPVKIFLENNKTEPSSKSLHCLGEFLTWMRRSFQATRQLCEKLFFLTFTGLQKAVKITFVSG